MVEFAREGVVPERVKLSVLDMGFVFDGVGCRLSVKITHDLIRKYNKLQVSQKEA